jgi:OmpA-OmpF porin, OOP family
MKRFLSIVLGIFFLATATLAQQKDSQGCQDHPLFSRMPGYWIRGCVNNEFNAYQFHTAVNKTQNVEGKYWKANFYPQNNLNPMPSDLQILRNFKNAVEKLGGRMVFEEKGRETMTVTRDGKEYWVEVWAEFTGKYAYTIVEKSAMKQDVVSSVDALADDLKATGHSAVYGIFFDTGKSDLKPESNQAIEEIAKLLKKDAGLKLYIVGHTDNVGGVESNMTLSEQRTNSVVDALVKQHGISASRLKSFGNGPFAPVASNDNDEGRARNRRVEIVKQ